MAESKEERLRAYHKAYHLAHRAKIKAKCGAWRELHKAEIPHKKRAYRYGITEEEFNRKLSAQGSACAICEELFKKAPHVDHDHTCCGHKKACGVCRRGLLCARCNLTLGAVRDSIPLLNRAVSYLAKYRRREILEVEGSDA
jgi:hypothetical protein